MVTKGPSENKTYGDAYDVKEHVYPEKSEMIKVEEGDIKKETKEKLNGFYSETSLNQIGVSVSEAKKLAESQGIKTENDLRHFQKDHFKEEDGVLGIESYLEMLARDIYDKFEKNPEDKKIQNKIIQIYEHGNICGKNIVYLATKIRRFRSLHNHETKIKGDKYYDFFQELDEVFEKSFKKKSKKIDKKLEKSGSDVRMVDVLGNKGLAGVMRGDIKAKDWMENMKKGISENSKIVPVIFALVFMSLIFGVPKSIYGKIPGMGNWLTRIPIVLGFLTLGGGELIGAGIDKISKDLLGDNIPEEETVKKVMNITGNTDTEKTKKRISQVTTNIFNENGKLGKEKLETDKLFLLNKKLLKNNKLLNKKLDDKQINITSLEINNFCTENNISEKDLQKYIKLLKKQAKTGDVYFKDILKIKEEKVETTPVNFASTETQNSDIQKATPEIIIEDNSELFNYFNIYNFDKINNELKENGIKLNLIELLKKYKTYIETNLEGKLNQNYLEKIKTIIQIKFNLISNIIQERIEWVDDQINDGDYNQYDRKKEIQNQRWIINENISDLFSDLNHKILPSALKLIKGNNLEGQEVIKMFDSEITDDGEFDKTWTSFEIWDANMNNWDVAEGNSIETPNLLSEKDKDIDDTATIAYFAYVGSMLIPYVGIATALPADVKDIFGDDEGVSSILRGIGVIDENYRMEKGFGDTILGGVSIALSLFGLQSIAKGEKLIKAGSKLDKIGLGKIEKILNTVGKKMGLSQDVVNKLFDMIKKVKTKSKEKIGNGIDGIKKLKKKPNTDIKYKYKDPDGTEKFYTKKADGKVYNDEGNIINNIENLELVPEQGLYKIIGKKGEFRVNNDGKFFDKAGNEIEIPKEQIQLLEKVTKKAKVEKILGTGKYKYEKDGEKFIYTKLENGEYVDKNGFVVKNLDENKLTKVKQIKDIPFKIGEKSLEGVRNIGNKLTGKTKEGFDSIWGSIKSGTVISKDFIYDLTWRGFGGKRGFLELKTRKIGALILAGGMSSEDIGKVFNDPELDATQKGFLIGGVLLEAWWYHQAGAIRGLVYKVFLEDLNNFLTNKIEN